MTGFPEIKRAMVWGDDIEVERASVRVLLKCLADHIYLDHHAPHGSCCSDCDDLIKVKRELLRVANEKEAKRGR